MAYRRRYRPRRFKRKRAPWYRRKYNAVQLAGKALSGVRYLKGLVNSEMLKVPYNATINPTNTGSVVHLTAIAQGDDDASRTGNSIFVRRIYGRFIYAHNTAAVNIFNRVVLFIDTQQVGDTPPTAAQLLESGLAISNLNTDTVGRFRILRNWFFTTDGVTKSTPVFNVDVNLRHHVRYNGTTTADIQKGGIYMLFISNQTTNTPACTYNVQLDYHDN